MDVRSCKKCGKLFNYVVGPTVCPGCRESLEEKFQEVKQYVQDHRGATIPEISQECSVDTKQINQWIREDRLEFAEDSPIRISCERCGTQIRSGRYCEICKADMTNTLSSAYKKTPSAPAPSNAGTSRSERDRMRFL